MLACIADCLSNGLHCPGGSVSVLRVDRIGFVCVSGNVVGYSFDTLLVRIVLEFL